VVIDEETNEYTGLIIRDERSDLEGIILDVKPSNIAKAKNIARIQQERYKPRMDAVGYFVQPMVLGTSHEE
jgi:hypothetical protein